MRKLQKNAGAIRVTLVFLALGVVALSGCRKKTVPEPDGEVKIPIEFRWESEVLNLNQEGYPAFGACCPGYELSVSKLHLFLSNPQYYPQPDGVEPAFFYIDLATPATHKIVAERIVGQSIDSLQFTAGLSSDWNVTGKLGNVTEYINMEWPEPIGGGYHHLKMEGHITGPDGDWGFAFHTGKTGFETRVALEGNGPTIYVDASQWFNHFTPASEQWNTMNRDSLMAIISNNSKVVFSWTD